jgi:hypothetical protein
VFSLKRLAENIWIRWSDIHCFTPNWGKNVRIFDWWACYSIYESDDQIVTAFLIPP